MMNILERITVYLDESDEYEDVYETARKNHMAKVEQTDKDYADKKLSKDQYHTKMIEHGKAFHKDMESRTTPARQKVIDTVTKERGEK